MIVKSGVILSGFSMIEMLLALMGISIFVPMVVSGTQLLMFDQGVQNFDFDNYIIVPKNLIYSFESFLCTES